MSKSISLLTGTVLLAGLLMTQVAGAASDCSEKAVSKDGKPLSGAAKTAFIKKCEKDNPAPSSCADKAIDKNGKPLAGAAKNSFMKKCEAGK